MEEPSKDAGLNMVDIVIKSAETLSLVLVGVFASRLNERWHWVLLVIAVLTLVLAQYLQSVRKRAATARSWLISYLSDATNLHSAIREIKSHGCGDTWTKGEFIAAIPWWFDEDLMLEWYWKNEEASKQSRTLKGNRIQQSLRHPIRSLFSAWHALERHLASEPPLKLLETVSRLSEEEVARLVIAAGIEKGYLVEKRTVIDERTGYSDIFYTLNN